MKDRRLRPWQIAMFGFPWVVPVAIHFPCGLLASCIALGCVGLCPFWFACWPCMWGMVDVGSPWLWWGMSCLLGVSGAIGFLLCPFLVVRGGVMQEHL